MSRPIKFSVLANMRGVMTLRVAACTDAYCLVTPRKMADGGRNADGSMWSQCR